MLLILCFEFRDNRPYHKRSFPYAQTKYYFVVNDLAPFLLAVLNDKIPAVLYQQRGESDEYESAHFHPAAGGCV